jgi:hypothetical protein
MRCTFLLLWRLRVRGQRASVVQAQRHIPMNTALKQQAEQNTTQKNAPTF